MADDIKKELKEKITQRMHFESTINEFYVNYLNKDINKVYQIVINLINKLLNHPNPDKRVSANKLLEEIQPESISFLLDELLTIYDISEEEKENIYEQLGLEILKNPNFDHKSIIQLNPNVFNMENIDTFFLLFNSIKESNISINKYDIPFTSKDENEIRREISSREVEAVFIKLNYFLSLFNFIEENTDLFITNNLKKEKQKELNIELEKKKQSKEIINEDDYNVDNYQFSFIEIIDTYVVYERKVKELNEEKEQLREEPKNNSKESSQNQDGGQKNQNSKRINEINNEIKQYNDYINHTHEILKQQHISEEGFKKFVYLIDKNKENFVKYFEKDFQQLQKILTLLKFINPIVDINLFFVIINYLIDHGSLSNDCVDLLNEFIQEDDVFESTVHKLKNDLSFDDFLDDVDNELKDIRSKHNIDEMEIKEKTKILSNLINKISNKRSQIIKYINEHQSIIMQQILVQDIKKHLSRGMENEEVDINNYFNFIDAFRDIRNDINYLESDTYKLKMTIFNDSKHLYDIGENIQKKSNEINYDIIQNFIYTITNYIDKLYSSEIAILYIFYLFAKERQPDKIVSQTEFTLLVYDEYVFILTHKITLNLFSSLETFLSENPDMRKKKHVFVVSLYEFLLHYKENYLNKFSLKGSVSYKFKELMRYAHNKGTEVSDISITGYNSRNIGYVLIREGNGYNAVCWKEGDVYTPYISFNEVSNFIKDIMAQGGQISDTINSDTSFSVGLVMYRVGIGKDGDCLTITIRGAPQSQDKNYEADSFILKPKLLENVSREIGLEDSYFREDVEVFKGYALQPTGLIVFASPTGSGKSLSQRNLIGEVQEKKVKEEGITPKVIELTDTVEHRDLNLTQLEMDADEIEEQGELILKRANPDSIIYSEIRTSQFLKSALDIAKTWSVMTTFHSYDVLEAVGYLKSRGDEINKDLGEIVSNVKFLISQILFPVIKDVYLHGEEIKENYILGSDEKSMSKKESELMFLKDEFKTTLLLQGREQEEADELWDKFYEVFIKGDIIGILPQEYVKNSMTYEYLTKTDMRRILRESGNNIGNIDYETATKMYSPKEELILRRIYNHESPMTAFRNCSIQMLPFTFKKMLDRGDFNK